MTFFTSDPPSVFMSLPDDSSAVNHLSCPNGSGEDGNTVQIGFQPEDDTARAILDTFLQEESDDDDAEMQDGRPYSSYEFMHPSEGGRLELHLSFRDQRKEILYGQLRKITDEESIQPFVTDEVGEHIFKQKNHHNNSEEEAPITWEEELHYILHLRSTPTADTHGSGEVEKINRNNRFVRNCYDTVIQLGGMLESYQYHYGRPAGDPAPVRVYREEGGEAEYIELPPPPQPSGGEK
ncbi:hypothetical protein ADEAN_000035800 [Angomonas deanei]|uniref:Uncharacterized protein n=1 Tax=Angomonas deanei TaxID=59799 RepID=A0A7G2C4V3_9TRYP|nr:hypothetical protein ADEAN_000035800 [Angomonas deanei]